MNINFNESTYEKLIYLATRENSSVAAYVARKMDEHTGQLVNVQYSMNILPTDAKCSLHEGEQAYFVASDGICGNL